MKCSKMPFRIEGRSSSISNHNINSTMIQVLQHQDRTTPELQVTALSSFLRDVRKLPHERKTLSHREKRPRVSTLVRRSSSPSQNRKTMKARKRDLQLELCRRVTIRELEPISVKKTSRPRSEECHRQGGPGEQGLLLVSLARRWRTLPASPAPTSQVCAPTPRQ